MTVTETETTDGAYTVIKWTTDLAAGAGQDSTTWDADAAGVSEVQYLVVAGGGSVSGRADIYYHGGGGAGGMREGTKFAVSGTITVKVGAGASRPTTNVNGNQGANSQFSTIESVGGGYGAYSDGNGGGGGSGGGAGGHTAATTGGAATSGQGSAGGNHAADATGSGGAGGGGAGGAGGDNSGATGGTGGAAKASSITGSSVYYAGGGYGGAGHMGSIGSDGTGYSRDGYGMGGRGDTPASGYGTGTNGVVIIRFLTPSINNFSGVSIGSANTMEV